MSGKRIRRRTVEEILAEIAALEKLLEDYNVFGATNSQFNNIPDRIREMVLCLQWARGEMFYSHYYSDTPSVSIEREIESNLAHQARQAKKKGAGE
jgi:hypothetical protein